MKFFKYLFFLIVLVFVIGSLYIATISIPQQNRLTFSTPVNSMLYISKVKDLSTYKMWFEFPQEPISEKRLSNIESPGNTILSWQNEKFESINLQNLEIAEDSISQKLKLKTWLSTSEFEITWNFEASKSDSKLIVELTSEASFWQKTESVLTGITHAEILKKAIQESLSKLEDIIVKEISAYDISPMGKVDTGGFYILHATSAARLNFESILKKSNPIFESVEFFMKKQNFEEFKERIILFENLYQGANTIIFSSGVGTENQIAIPDNFEVLSKYLRRGTYFKTQLTGSYDNLKELLAFSKSLVDSRGLTLNNAQKPYLEFEVDENDTINPSKWITNFYIPVIEN